MDKAFIIDTRTNVFTVKEAEVIEIVDMVLKCRVDGEVFKVRRGNYFETKKKGRRKIRGNNLYWEVQKQKERQKYKHMEMCILWQNII